MKTKLSLARESKFFMLVVAGVSFAIGYSLFSIIGNLENSVLSFFDIYLYSTSGIFLNAVIEMIVFGGISYVIYLLSKQPYLPILVFLGLLTKYYIFISNLSVVLSETQCITQYSFIFIYMLVGLLLVLGLKYGRLYTGFSIFLGFVIIASHNYLVLMTPFGEYINLLFRCAI